MPEISVIIPALNEEKYIPHSLYGLAKQSFRDFETIVVDGGSRDRTRSIVKKSGAKLIVSGRRGASGARNAGAAAAKGRILLFLDADTKPSYGLLKAYHGIFKNDGIVASTGPICPLERASARVKWGYRFVSVYFVKASILVHRPSIVGSNFAVRSDAFRRAGGFNEKFVTYEDWDLSSRLKKYGRIKYGNSAKVYTSVRRITAWGISGFLIYYLVNILLYHTIKKPRRNYKRIR